VVVFVIVGWAYLIGGSLANGMAMSKMLPSIAEKCLVKVTQLVALLLMQFATSECFHQL
jgi:hypothetical protein